MSEFQVRVVRLGELTKHPNADVLSVTRIADYPVICRTEDWRPGDLAVYVPIDSVVPADDPRWEFLAGHTRIRAKKLRGIFSMGLLTQPEPGWVEGQDVTEALGITKYEPPVHFSRGESEPDPGFIPVYTDIEGLRRHPDILQDGEEVVLTEKLHGANGRFVWHEGRLWVGSHTQIKREDPGVIWWKAAEQLDLANRLPNWPGIVLYGEVYGRVQDLRYGMAEGIALAFFDAYSIPAGRYLDYEDFVLVTNSLGLPRVPLIHRGPWSKELLGLAEGKTTVPGADHCREGFVVRPVVERWDDQVGRVVLKLIGEDYLLRKGG
jgi:RNA ligase (TIGR02306 family)